MLQIMLAAFVAFALTVGFTLFVVFSQSATLHRYLVSAHANRLADQARTDSEIQQLVCLAISPYPDSTGQLVKEFRAKYKCPAYEAAGSPITGPTSSTSP